MLSSSATVTSTGDKSCQCWIPSPQFRAAWKGVPFTAQRFCKQHSGSAKVVEIGDVGNISAASHLDSCYPAFLPQKRKKWAHKITVFSVRVPILTFESDSRFLRNSVWQLCHRRKHEPHSSKFPAFSNNSLADARNWEPGAPPVPLKLGTWSDVWY